MEPAAEQIRDQQKATWNKFSSGWRKWDEFTMDFLAPMGEALITSLSPNESDQILDVATGTGEPGISIARIVSKGKVVGIDLSEGMLAVAIEQAKAKGVENFETMVCDVMNLPFADNTFDAISCRFGYMFFPDMDLATNELVRVLKPGGKIATAVWAEPAGNNWVTAMMAPLNETLQIAPAPAGATGIFRCQGSGMIENIFSNAGLKNISTKDISADRDFISKQWYWNYMNDVVAPVVSAMSNASDEQKEIIQSKVFGIIDKLNPQGGAIFQYKARIISAVK
ncbi:MAG: class I SAM-dependent methyltransferase [Ignavibacteriota bacterium]